MSEVRKFLKGDKLEANKGFIYEVVGNETDGGSVRAKLIDQPEVSDPRQRFGTSEQKFNASALRRSWTMLEEGKAPRHNNRVTKVAVSNLRLGEKVRWSTGAEFVVKKLKGNRGVWTITGEDGSVRSIDGTDTLEVLGARGRALPKTVHYNPFADPGTVTFQRNHRQGFGSGACGVVSNIDVFAQDVDLVTCEQACKEKAREDHWRREARKAKEANNA